MYNKKIHTVDWGKISHISHKSNWREDQHPTYKKNSQIYRKNTYNPMKICTSALNNPFKKKKKEIQKAENL